MVFREGRQAQIMPVFISIMLPEISQRIRAEEGSAKSGDTGEENYVHPYVLERSYPCEIWVYQ